MATRRRKRSTRRRTIRARAHNPINPTRRRRRSTRRRSVYTRARHHNPVRHRRRRSGRRRNPVSGGLIMSGFRLAAAGAVIGLAQPFVRNLAAPYVGASPLASAGITFGTAWLLSMGARFLPFARKYENDILLAGATIAGAQIISAYVTPRLGFGGSNPLMSGPRYRRGMRGIGLTTGIPPTVVPPPLPAPGARNGMQGLSTVPGVYAR